MVKLRNRDLLASSMFYYNREVNEFNEEELSLIKEIHFKYGNENIEDLKLFTGLVNLVFSNMEIDGKLIQILKGLEHLENVTFDNCKFLELPVLTNIKGLHISETEIDVNFLGDLNNLKSLSLEYMNVDNLEFINKLNNLEVMSFTGSKLPERIALDNTNIKELHIDGVILNSIDNLMFPKDLETIYISKIQYLLNPEYFNDLKKYGIEVNYGLDTEFVE